MAMLGFNPTYNGIAYPIGWSEQSELQPTKCTAIAQC